MDHIYTHIRHIFIYLFIYIYIHILTLYIYIYYIYTHIYRYNYICIHNICDIFLDFVSDLPDLAFKPWLPHATIVSQPIFSTWSQRPLTRAHADFFWVPLLDEPPWMVRGFSIRTGQFLVGTGTYMQKCKLFVLFVFLLLQRYGFVWVCLYCKILWWNIMSIKVPISGIYTPFSDTYIYIYTHTHTFVGTANPLSWFFSDAKDCLQPPVPKRPKHEKHES